MLSCVDLEPFNDDFLSCFSLKRIFFVGFLHFDRFLLDKVKLLKLGLAPRLIIEGIFNPILGVEIWLELEFGLFLLRRTCDC